MDRSKRPNALVTGGGRRLGRHLSLALAAAGYDLAVTAWRSVPEAEALADELAGRGARCVVVPADLRDQAVVADLIEQVENTLGPLSLLVNNAGVIATSGDEDLEALALDDTYAVNVRAPYVLSLTSARSMRARGDGSIVNVASVGGLRPYGQYVAYSVSKAALVMMTKALAKRLAPHVRVNAVAPGTLWFEGEERDDLPKPAVTSIPAQRYGRGEEVAEAVLYLARASFVTGQVLPVDGGATL